MVALGAAWTNVTEPYIFEKGDRLNGAMYREHLLPFYKEKGDRFLRH